MDEALSTTSSEIDTNWCVFFRWQLTTLIWTFSMPLGSKWCGYFNHKAWLTILASVCHQRVSGMVISTTRPGSPFWPLCVPSGSKWCGYFNHKAWLTILASLCAIFVCHQVVSGVVISTTGPGSPFWPLCVPSVCKWCGYFNHKAWLTILASLCAISE